MARLLPWYRGGSVQRPEFVMSSLVSQNGAASAAQVQARQLQQQKRVASAAEAAQAEAFRQAIEMQRVRQQQVADTQQLMTDLKNKSQIEKEARQNTIT
jgi:hypothetical protein